MQSVRVIIWLSLMLATSRILFGDVQLSEAHYDADTGLIVHYPGNWRLETDVTAFAIASFLERQTPRLVLVPLDGAEIVVLCPPKRVQTVSQWLEYDRVSLARRYRIGEVALSTAHYGTVAATRVERESEAIPAGQSVGYYFTLGGRLYKTALFYRGQKRAGYFESVVVAVIYGLEPGMPRRPKADR